MNLREIQKKKLNKEKITMLTCYDYWSARMLNASSIDMLLVGDSAAMVMHGHSSTVPADIDLMKLHVESVTRGAPDKFVVGDLPFLSYRKDHLSNMASVEALMRAGAQAVKLEGARGNLELITHLVHSGVPVMGHLGLTPQHFHQMGGFRVQGRKQKKAEEIFQQSMELQEAGCFAMVLECVPFGLAARIAKELDIPVIGIGAGVDVDGQVLVLHDMLGFNEGFQPKFLREYLKGRDLMLNAIEDFSNDVKQGHFPDRQESYE
jgi:3-methyl-2-oxobutanoate hydroxymethyltransferase